MGEDWVEVAVEPVDHVDARIGDKAAYRSAYGRCVGQEVPRAVFDGTYPPEEAGDVLERSRMVIQI